MNFATIEKKKKEKKGDEKIKRNGWKQSFLDSSRTKLTFKMLYYIKMYGKLFYELPDRIIYPF